MCELSPAGPRKRLTQRLVRPVRHPMPRGRHRLGAQTGRVSHGVLIGENHHVARLDVLVKGEEGKARGALRPQLSEQLQVSDGGEARFSSIPKGAHVGEEAALLGVEVGGAP